MTDLANNKPVEVQITGESQVRKLPAPMAQRIAARLKGTPAEGAVANGAAGGSTGNRTLARLMELRRRIDSPAIRAVLGKAETSAVEETAEAIFSRCSTACRQRR